MDAVNTIQVLAQFVNMLIISLVAAAIMTWAWKKFRTSDVSSRRIFLILSAVFVLALFAFALISARI